MTEAWALGVDIGSVTIKFLLLDRDDQVRLSLYRRTMGDPLGALVSGMEEVVKAVPADARIAAAGTTGSGRVMAGMLLGADVVKNEITAHAVGTLQWRGDVRTIIEIGGQDSKIIHLQDGKVVDFAMNSVCAAGTGAFLDQQASRLQIPVESFGRLALTAKKAVRISGRCSVFAESDMIHKQQVGHGKAEICLGLCQALVRNYLNNVARGKRLANPVSFQGGVAYNQAIVHCMREALPNNEILVPPLMEVRGALGAALLARQKVGEGKTRFVPWQGGSFSIQQEICDGCTNQCDIFFMHREGSFLAHWGGRCERKKHSPGSVARSQQPTSCSVEE
jgi:predicted CoA-substrate-specific enzyme activase